MRMLLTERDEKREFLSIFLGMNTGLVKLFRVSLWSEGINPSVISICKTIILEPLFTGQWTSTQVYGY
jgi:hypothetical protein